MADNFTLFSEELVALAPAEIEWLQQQLEFVQRDDQNDLPRFMQEAMEEGQDQFLESDDGLGFGFEFFDDRLWMYSHECGSPAHAAVLMQRFLKQFRPHDWWSISWAATCSKPRVGQFGGGALLVTATKIFAESGWSFVERKLEELGLSSAS